MATRKSNTQLRNDMRDQLKLAVADKGIVLTDELNAKIEVKVMEAHPFQRDELPGFTTKAILTYEEVAALAVAAGLVDYYRALEFVSDSSRGNIFPPIQEHEVTNEGTQLADVSVASNLPEINQVREATVRTTAGTEWSQYGAVFLFRPARETTKKDDTKDVLDDILG